MKMEGEICVMDLTKLFEAQRILDERIIKEHGLEGQDLLQNKILALLVELGECANEWRGFKHWSNDQKPRVEEDVKCSVCNGTGDLNWERVQEDAEGNGNHEYIDCEECDLSGLSGTRNPLLEEYVDCLHFLLSITNDMKQQELIHDVITERKLFEYEEYEDITSLLTFIFYTVSDLRGALIYDSDYAIALSWIRFIALGNKFGFTWEQVEEAYFAKNKVNHTRQEDGY